MQVTGGLMMGESLLVLADEEYDEPMKPGTKVEVRQRFDDRWTRGFEVVEDTGEGLRIRRLSDGTVLPVHFARDEVRREKKQGMWWY
jgi:hypothetical protein